MIRHLYILVVLILSSSFVHAEQIYSYDNSIVVLYGDLIKEAAPYYEASDGTDSTYLAVLLPAPITLMTNPTDPLMGSVTVNKIQLSYANIYKAAGAQKTPIKVSCRLYPASTVYEFTPVMCDLKVFRLNVRPIGISTTTTTTE